MSEKTIIEQCAPTLAGLKTGSLFSTNYDGDLKKVKSELRKLNSMLRKKGIRMILLRHSGERILIYLYRPERLARDLQDPQAQMILEEKGYYSQDADRCIVQLLKHFSFGEDFPHEIGLFLGYPPVDVQGFMTHSRDGVKRVGYWKVYGDVEQADLTFARFRKCTDAYRKQYEKGKTLMQLAV